MESVIRAVYTNEMRSLRLIGNTVEVTAISVLSSMISLSFLARFGRVYSSSCGGPCR